MKLFYAPGACSLSPHIGPLFNPAITPEARAAAIANLGRKFKLIDQGLADGRPYLTGPGFTIADAYLFVVQSWAPMFSIDLTPLPHLVAFGQRVAARPAAQAAREAERLPKAA